MKKNLNSRLLFLFCFVAALTFRCGGGDDDVVTASCEKDVQKFQSALTAYTNDFNSVSKCQALKAAADDLIDCPGVTAGQRKEYEDAVAGLVCD